MTLPKGKAFKVAAMVPPKTINILGMSRKLVMLALIRIAETTRMVPLMMPMIVPMSI